MGFSIERIYTKEEKILYASEYLKRQVDIFNMTHENYNFQEAVQSNLTAEMKEDISAKKDLKSISAYINRICYARFDIIRMKLTKKSFLDLYDFFGYLLDFYTGDK